MQHKLATAALSLYIVAFLTIGANAWAAKPFTWLPRGAREIVRTTSASRDTPLFEFAYGPRAQASVGGEFGLVALHGSSLTLTAGMYAMIALENATSDVVFPPAQLWRGLIGWSVAVSMDKLARRWFGRGSALEVGLVLGHESDHEDGYLDFDQEHSRFHDEIKPDAIPDGGGGDFLTPDVAWRLGAKSLITTTFRLQNRFYVRGSLSHAPGVDAIVRLRALSWMQPTLALYGEHLFPSDQAARDGLFVRGLLGLAFPGKMGEVTPFLSVDAGNGKGLLIHRRELRLSTGVRYAAF